VKQSGGEAERFAALKILAVTPSRPDDPGELVRERHRGFVVTSPALYLQGPLAQPVERYAASPLGGRSTRTFSSEIAATKSHKRRTRCQPQAFVKR